MHYVYWGTHGCSKGPSHTTHCRCSCGDVLHIGYHVYGEDADTAKFWLGKPWRVGPRRMWPRSEIRAALPPNGSSG